MVGIYCPFITIVLLSSKERKDPLWVLIEHLKKWSMHIELKCHNTIKYI